MRLARDKSNLKTLIMVRLIISFVTLLVLVCVTNFVTAVTKRDHNDYNKNPKRIVCYVGSWSNFHSADPFKMENIDPFLCTHLIYGFAKLNENNYLMEPFDPHLDDKKLTSDLRGYERLNNLRKQNPLLTTIISLGGRDEGSQKFSFMARRPNLRKLFVNSTVEFLIEHDFDGLDLDWEFPSNGGGDPKVDKRNYITLLTELKEAFESHGFLLTASVSGVKDTIDSAYSIPQMNDLLDFINVMAYDYHGSWEDRLVHNAPLYKRSDETDELSTVSNVNYTVHYCIEKGMDKKKMVLGMPFYGSSWTLESPDKVKLNDIAKGTAPPGFIFNKNGVLIYDEICQIQQNQTSEWTIKYDPFYKAPYAYNKTVWVGYDNAKSLSCKITFLKKMGLSGGMVYSIDNDDFNGKCGGGKYPLLHKVHQMLNGDGKDSFECTIGTL